MGSSIYVQSFKILQADVKQAFSQQSKISVISQLDFSVTKTPLTIIVCYTKNGDYERLSDPDITNTTTWILKDGLLIGAQVLTLVDLNDINKTIGINKLKYLLFEGDYDDNNNIRFIVTPEPYAGKTYYTNPSPPGFTLR